MNSIGYKEVLSFWFEETGESKWWKKNPEFDALITKNFSDLHSKAIQGELYVWRQHPEGRLAEIIVLDQFSRNIYRDQTMAFAADPLALALAQEAVSIGADRELATTQRNFLYMPYMHSESREIHEVAITLFDQPGLESNLEYELKHKAIIDRFGRYPHRNEILGRDSTEEELEFLKQQGSGF